MSIGGNGPVGQTTPVPSGGTVDPRPADAVGQARREAAALAGQFGISREQARAVQQVVLLQAPELTGAARQAALAQAAGQLAHAGGHDDTFQRAAPAGGQATARQAPALSAAVLSQVGYDPSAGPVLPLPKNSQPEMRELQAVLPKFTGAQALAKLPDLPADQLGGQVNWTALLVKIAQQRRDHFWTLQQAQQVVSRSVTQVNLTASATQSKLVEARVNNERTQSLMDNVVNAHVEANTDLQRGAGGRLTGTNPAGPLENQDIDIVTGNTASTAAIANQKRRAGIAALAGLPADAASTAAKNKRREHFYDVAPSPESQAQAASQAALRGHSGPQGGAGLPPPEGVIGTVAYPGGPLLRRSFLAADEQALLSPAHQAQYNQFVEHFNGTHINSLLTRRAHWAREEDVLRGAAASAGTAAKEAQARGDHASGKVLEGWATVHRTRADDIGRQTAAVSGEINFLDELGHTNSYGVGEAQSRQRESIGNRGQAEEEAKKANAQRFVARPVGANDDSDDLARKAALANDIEWGANHEVIQHAAILARAGRDKVHQWDSAALEGDYHQDLTDLEAHGRRAAASNKDPADRAAAQRDFDLTQAKIDGLRRSAPPQIVNLLDLSRLSKTPADRARYADTIAQLRAGPAINRSLVQRHIFGLEQATKARLHEAVVGGDKQAANDAHVELARLKEHYLFLAAPPGRAAHTASAVDRRPVTDHAEATLDNLHRLGGLQVAYTPPAGGTPSERLRAQEAHDHEVVRARAHGAVAASSRFDDKAHIPLKIVHAVANQAGAFTSISESANNSAQNLAAGAAGLAASLGPALDQTFLGPYHQARGLFAQLDDLAHHAVLFL